MSQCCSGHVYTRAIRGLLYEAYVKCTSARKNYRKFRISFSGSEFPTEILFINLSIKKAKQVCFERGN
jgi:hypothetical protein